MPTSKEVLIVDNDTFVREQIADHLITEGFLVRQADNGVSGLQALRNGIPDLLICGLSMPIMTGIELVEEAVIEYPMLPIIVLSDEHLITEVAHLLRLGVKDFLNKPIRNKKAFLNSVYSTLTDALKNSNQHSDFCQQWFNVSNSSKDPISKELSWHLDELSANPEMAKKLLLGLMPEKSSKNGNWVLRYHSLQSADTNPIILDYAWMMDGKMSFYIVDSASAGANGVATTLMIRAFFNEYLRTPELDKRSYIRFIHKMEHAIKNSQYVSPIKVLFGVLNVVECRIDLLCAGLSLRIESDQELVIDGSQPLLGAGIKNTPLQSIFLRENKAIFSLAKIGLTNFRIEFEYKLIEM